MHGIQSIQDDLLHWACELRALFEPPRRVPLPPSLELRAQRRDGVLTAYELRARVDLGPDELRVRAKDGVLEIEGEHPAELDVHELRFARRFVAPGLDARVVEARIEGGTLVIRAPVAPRSADSDWREVPVLRAA
jgi:hypothetical protein